MDILTEIIIHKRKEVAQAKVLYPIKTLEKSTYFERKTISLIQNIQRKYGFGIIAEIKRKSPSKGMINAHVSIEETSIGYVQAGVSGLSILTDTKYFGGSVDDLKVGRSHNACPILRKDFMIDEYQVIEAKSIGADVILLIASCLKSKEVKKLGTLAQELGMEVLLEVHNEEELQESICEEINLVGVNNRNLKTFETNVQTSKDLAEKIPKEFVKISESGISNPDTIKELKSYGYGGFLIGENFMKYERPECAAEEFIKQLK